jgi:hypothetical protein
MIRRCIGSFACLCIVRASARVGARVGGGAVGYRGFPTFHCWQHFGFCDKPLVAGMVMIVMCHVLEL